MVYAITRRKMPHLVGCGHTNYSLLSKVDDIMIDWRHHDATVAMTETFKSLPARR